MPWRVSVHSEPPIIETVYSGLLSHSELFEAVQATIAAVEKHGLTLLLGDCSTLEGGHSVVDLFQLVESVVAHGVSHAFKEAVILPEVPDSAENAKFWETVCLNRGIKVKLFQERASAVTWLMET